MRLVEPACIWNVFAGVALDDCRGKTRLPACPTTTHGPRLPTEVLHSVIGTLRDERGASAPKIVTHQFGIPRPRVECLYRVRNY
jgi:hypothetical protein